MNEQSNILLCVATEKGFEVLQAAVDLPAKSRLMVCTFKEKGVAESFDVKIRETAEAAGIPIVRWREFRDDPLAFLGQYSVSAIVCIGWRYLVPENAIRALDGEVIIAHDSLLPKFRGFAPLVTAMITGETRTGVTFLRAGPGVDDGEVLWQGEVDIAPDDTIATLIRKVTPLYREGASRYLRGELHERTVQDESHATYSIWRDAEDYRIDWLQDAEVIERSIRALGPPYLGAQTQLQGRTVVIHEARLAGDLDYAIRQPGKIASLDAEGRPTVVCGRGLLQVLSATADGENILPLKALRLRFQ
jgi:methionyl-tRNA formyltransferase